MSKKYFITGIDTDSGKTVASAALVQALQSDYWKPVQAGTPTDSDTIRELVKSATVHPEGLFLKHPMSPHASAELEKRTVGLEDLRLPQTENSLIIEGAGGIKVPLNATEFVIDIAQQFDLEVILVSRNYLGSINHTLLSIDYLKFNGYKIKGIVFNGEPNHSTENFILNYSELPCLFRIPQFDHIDSSEIRQIASTINPNDYV